MDRDAMDEAEHERVDRASAEWSRRRTLGVLGGASLGAMAPLAAPSPARARTAAQIDRSVADALGDLFRIRPGARALASSASGALVIPDIIKASFLIGAAFGEGALIVDQKTDSYWSFTAGSIGVQAGAQRTRLAIFFLTDRSLRNFLSSDGVTMGLDAELTVIDAGAELRLDTLRRRDEVVAFIFGRAGLLGGASYSGGKYRRINR